MQNLNGRLQYLGWLHRPWRLITDEGETDLWPIAESFFLSLAGERASHHGEESYTLFADPESEDQFIYEPDGRIVLEGVDKPRMANVQAYLDKALISLSGRMVDIEVDEAERSFRVTADPSEEVFGVYFVDGGNSCGVPEGVEKTVCKVGQGQDSCVFLSFDGGGFRCEKFSGPTARLLLDRLAKGTIRAGRIGNCALLGR